MNKRADMTETAEPVEADNIETVDEVEQDIDDAQLQENDETETQPEAEAEEVEAGDVVVTIGDDPAADDDGDTAAAPEWVRNLRKEARELKRKNRELEGQLKGSTGAAKPAELAPRPKPGDYGYDLEAYDKAIDAWHVQKRDHDALEAAKQAKQKQMDDEWSGKVQGYQEAKKTLKVADYDDAEEVVQDTMTTVQQGMILQGAENAALLVYALGKNPAKARELAAIEDPVKFAFAVARLETQLKVSNKRPASNPEKMVSGTGRPSGSVDNTLEKLREEAARTGDFSKVAAYRKKARSKG